ncbi:MAG: hypothetical protein O2975_03160 [Proteobacteria bacterium]|nr:hypothetical protein [Pseudomonadota bacterium]
MSLADPLLRLLARLGEESVEYVLVGGQAVRLNGFLRATEDIDLLVRASRENGERIKRALGFLASSKDIELDWFEAQDGAPEYIRVADDLIVDLLFADNGETYDSVQAHVREIVVEGVRVRVLNIDGLLKTKTRTREKDLLDRSMLEKIQRGLDDGG